jgi:tRNA threonylcarbamoyladenosine biosynthesis protein TsaE
VIRRVVATTSQEATQAVGGALADLALPGDVLLLSGDLGAGKTQLTKGLAAGLGVVEPVTSPTFNILLVHQGRIPLFHFDLYRLSSADQLEDLDYWGTLEADGISVVEWGDRFAEAAPPECVSVTIRLVSDEARELEIVGQGVRGEKLAQAWVSACAELLGVSVLAEEVS